MTTDEPDLFGETFDFEEEISSRCEWLRRETEKLLAFTLPFLRNFLAGSDGYRAEAVILTQAWNDFHALLIELNHGSGRPALRSARALVEHAVNYVTVQTDPAQAERYLGHMDFEAEYSLNFELYHDLLPPSARRISLRQARHRHNKVKSRLAQALAKYGLGFRRGWSDANLLDRAKKHGLESLYPGYRLASLLIHGSAGGLLGTLKEIDGKRVYRTGPDFRACGIAYVLGLVSFGSILDDAAKTRTDLDPAIAIRCLSNFLARFVEYRNALVSLDRAMWPKEPPRHPTAMLCVSPTGRLRWYWYDPTTQVILEADAPTLEAFQQSEVDELVRRVVADPELYLRPSQRYAIVDFENPIAVVPKPTAKVLHRSVFD